MNFVVGGVEFVVGFEDGVWCVLLLYMELCCSECIEDLVFFVDE